MIFFQISVKGFFLGLCSILGIKFYLSTNHSWKIFGIYVAILSTFHFTEFLAIAFTNPNAVSTDTYIINHSLAYSLAAIASWTEYLFEKYFFLFMKQDLWIHFIGLLFCIFGEFIRKTAIFTAKKNFNHIVQNEKDNSHVLVTHGVYNIFRHPSYVGWFYWSIGTQVNIFFVNIYD